MTGSRLLKGYSVSFLRFLNHQQKDNPQTHCTPIANTKKEKGVTLWCVGNAFYSLRAHFYRPSWLHIIKNNAKRNSKAHRIGRLVLSPFFTLFQTYLLPSLSHSQGPNNAGVAPFFNRITSTLPPPQHNYCIISLRKQSF